MGPARVEATVVLPSEAAPRLTSDDLETWIAAQLDGSHPLWGPVDATTLRSRIFIGFAPAGTTITYGPATSCVDYQSYDAGVTLPSGAVAHYVVVPRCPSPRGVTQAEWTSLAAISSVIDRIGNPTPSRASTETAWAGFGVSQGGFAFGGAGLAGVCSQAVVGSDRSFTWPVNGLPLVPRSWSNAAANAYHDPCVPAPAGPYFVSVPVATDSLTLPTGEKIQGVLVPAGGSKTIDVRLLSDAPTGPWWVSTQLLDLGLPRAGTSGFSFRWDWPVGKDGDTLHLTISAPTPPRQDVVAIYSTRDQRRTFWLLPLQSK